MNRMLGAVSRALRTSRWSLVLVGMGLPLASSLADEGMWTLDQLPVHQMQAKYGFSPDAAWVGHVQRSALRLAGGCSGSFISPNGLVMTNHHCVRECVQQISSAEKNYVADGFYARDAKDEKLCPTIELDRLDAISDVTARMKAVVHGMDGAAFTAAQKAEKSKIEAACVGRDAERTRCDVVELYHGGIYDLYQYHRFQDARLVFAPEEAIAMFGGDPDNFNFPRFDLDLGVLRAYEDGKPAKVADYLPFSRSGADEGELTMVVGHPATTQRQLTMAQLDRVRDLDLVGQDLYRAELRGMLNQFAEQGAEAERTSEIDRLTVENSLKARRGQLEALLDPEVTRFKQAQEQALRAYVAASPSRKARFGQAWDAIAQAQVAYAAIETPYKYLEAGFGALPSGMDSDYYRLARDLVRGAAERSKPNGERLHEYTDSALPAVTQRLFSNAPIYPELEKATLAWSLTKLREALGADDALVHGVLGSESPRALATRLVEGTRLGDPATRKSLWDGGQPAIDASQDPFIQFAKRVDAPARALRSRYEDEVEAIEKKNAELIAQARFEKYGTSVYPDATFTLRLSYGAVRGWDEKGHTVPPFTDFGGAFARATGFDPFQLPQSWIAARDRINGAQRFNFSTTNDIIGGNSGSPMINRNAEVVGLIFDGNIHSLGGAFWYDERTNRTVAVHSGAILEALRHIYGADQLADEIEAARKT